MTVAAAHLGMFGKAEANDRAPECGVDGSATLMPESVVGKVVVVVNFWTYTCINWLRTLPYVRAWAKKYRQGLVVVGVHTPEFAFERNLSVDAKFSDERHAVAAVVHVRTVR